MSKCPPEKRVLREFDYSNHEQRLVAIPMIEDLPYGDRLFARPNKSFDLIHKDCSEGWFPTKTYLFPHISAQIGKVDEFRYAPKNQTLILSFANDDDAMLARMKLPKTVLLPDDWWAEFEGAEYRRHPIYPEFETNPVGLIRIDGEHADICPSARVTIRSHTLIRDSMPTEAICRTVDQIIEDTWSVASPRNA